MKFWHVLVVSAVLATVVIEGDKRGWWNWLGNEALWSWPVHEVSR